MSGKTQFSVPLHLFNLFSVIYLYFCGLALNTRAKSKVHISKQVLCALKYFRFGFKIITSSHSILLIHAAISRTRYLTTIN